PSSRAEDGRGKEQGPVRHRRGPVDLFSSDRSAQTRTQEPLSEGLSRVHMAEGEGLRLSHGGDANRAHWRCQRDFRRRRSEMAPANEARRALGMVTALCEAGAVFAVIIGWPFFSSASASPGAGSLP